MAVTLQVPRGISYLTPVGSVMRLFKRYQGHDAVGVRSAPSDLDIAASRTADTVFLHVANLNYDRSVEAVFTMERYPIIGGRVFEIASDHLRQAVSQDQPDVFVPKERSLGPGPEFKWRFPAASVSVVELRSCFQAGQCRS
jgi:alpha-N-arabinofuranosidase